MNVVGIVVDHAYALVPFDDYPGQARVRAQGSRNSNSGHPAAHPSPCLKPKRCNRNWPASPFPRCSIPQRANSVQHELAARGACWGLFNTAQLFGRAERTFRLNLQRIQKRYLLFLAVPQRSQLVTSANVFSSKIAADHEVQVANPLLSPSSPPHFRQLAEPIP